ncbi:hypothetical protein E3P89_03413 [Wallemia ichthyophaga]|nr:hypothetical protein E3P95_03406 [Wallemia ichthyophaga]TIB08791.1 hypothetical protein E3P93_03396 [Wallemia ichthyophaga]TIB20111.1 hypothetical protein E3P89_03413 [Wallemia ichthyophaga]
MSNARRLRQQKELEALQANEHEHEQVHEESKQPQQPPKVVNPFAALGGGGEDEEDEEDESGTPAPASSHTTHTSSSNKKKKKKSKADVNVAEGERLQSKPRSTQPHTTQKHKKGMNEIDEALRELNIKYPHEQTQAQTQSHQANTPHSTLSTLRTLLSVDPKHLDASAEMKKMFGSKVVSSATTMNSYGQGRARGRQARMQQMVHKATPRSNLSQHKPTWPPATSAKLDGMTMRQLSADELREWQERHALPPTINLQNSGSWWTFEHDAAYRSVQHQFLDATGSFDPNTLMALLQVYPYHVDTLNQVSEVFRMQGDNGTAGDFTERMLFAIERGFAMGFSALSGGCRVDFDRVENRALWLGLSRLITHLRMKGCWRTAYEYGKVMLALDPLTDPHGALLQLDFLAVKAGQYDWLLGVAGEWPYNHTHSVHLTDTTFLPGIAYARALATYYKGRSVHGKHVSLDATVKYFLQAVLAHPLVLSLLLEHNLVRVSAERGEVLKNVLVVEKHYEKYAPMHARRKEALARIYCAHSLPLYRDPALPVQAIVDHTLDALRADGVSERGQIDLAQRQMDSGVISPSETFPENVARHAIINNITDAKAFLPETFSEGDAFDPVAPSTSSSGYDAGYFAGMRGGRQMGAHSQSQQHSHTGGIVSLIESLLRGDINLGQMDPDTRVAFEEQVNQLQEGGMPGGFGGDWESEEEEGDGDGESDERDERDEHDQPEDNATQQPGIIDRFARMFAGNANQGNANDNAVESNRPHKPASEDDEGSGNWWGIEEHAQAETSRHATDDRINDVRSIDRLVVESRENEPNGVFCGVVIGHSNTLIGALGTPTRIGNDEQEKEEKLSEA